MRRLFLLAAALLVGLLVGEHLGVTRANRENQAEFRRLLEDVLGPNPTPDP